MAAIAKTEANGEPAGSNLGGCEGGTTDEWWFGCWYLFLVFIGREYNPDSDVGPLPSHSILLGGIVFI